MARYSFTYLILVILSSCHWGISNGSLFNSNLKLNDLTESRSDVFRSSNKIAMAKDKDSAGHYVYCAYIVKNGVKIYPRHGKKFKFWVKD